MPLSLAQLTLRNDYIQAEFHPLDHSLVVLFESGELKRFSLSGQEIWRFALPWKPLVFRIHIDGNLVAILGEGVLAFLDLQMSKMITVPVDKKYHLLEFYKSCALIGGYTNSVTFIKPNGYTLQSLSFQFFIDKIKAIPFSSNFFLYNKNRELICSNIVGERCWVLKGYRISGDIHVSEDGDLCIFMNNSDELIKFDVSGYHYFAIDHHIPVKNISLSSNGKYFMILDVENCLTMCNQDAHILWQHTCDHEILQIQLSRNGQNFFTIDSDQLLTCYEVHQTHKSTKDFLELEAYQRASDTQCLWVVQPGSHLPRTFLRLLTVNASGNGMGLIGQDGRVYFLDDSGQQHMAVSFPALVEAIGISDAFDTGYIYGDNRIQIINLRRQKLHQILLPKSLLGKPLVNFHHQKLWIITPENELWIYDFEGHVDRRVTLSETYHQAMSCEEAGFVLLQDQGLIGLSVHGQPLFTLPIEEGPEAFHYTENWIMGTTRQPSLLSVDLASLKVHQRRVTAQQSPVQMASLDPLLITFDERLVHLHRDLSVIATHPIQSPGSAFYLQEGQLYEVTSSLTRLVCYDEQGNLAWRYQSEDHIRDFKLTQNGIVLMTEQSLYYLGLRQREHSHIQLAQFLEL